MILSHGCERTLHSKNSLKDFGRYGLTVFQCSKSRHCEKLRELASKHASPQSVLCEGNRRGESRHLALEKPFPSTSSQLARDKADAETSTLFDQVPLSMA